jgi:hypothetical protein
LRQLQCWLWRWRPHLIESRRPVARADVGQKAITLTTQLVNFRALRVDFSLLLCQKNLLLRKTALLLCLATLEALKPGV